MQACVFKIALSDDSRVWRTVVLKDTQTLDDLHEIIQESFEWHSDHMYAFFMSNRLQWTAGDAYGPPEADLANDSDVPIATLKMDDDDQFLYVYDFDQEWLVEITFVEHVPIEKGRHYPDILDSEGEAMLEFAIDGDVDDDWDDDDDDDDDLLGKDGWSEEGEDDY